MICVVGTEQGQSEGGGGEEVQFSHLHADSTLMTLSEGSRTYYLIQRYCAVQYYYCHTYFDQLMYVQATWEKLSAQYALAPQVGIRLCFQHIFCVNW